MSQENVELERRGNEARNRRDIDAWLEGFHADVEAHDLPTIPDAPVSRGHEDLRKWVEMMGDIWTKESYYEPEEFTVAGDFVLVAVRPTLGGEEAGLRSRSASSGVRDARREGHRVWSFFDKAEALEAAGLSE